MKPIVLVLLLLASLLACTKKEGKNPSLAYSDRALLDTCRIETFSYYKNDPSIIYSGSFGQHGPFKLRFNALAKSALKADGKLAIGALMPEGAFIVKDVYSGGTISLFAFMYKKSGSWLWGEIEPNGSVHYSVNKNSSLCVNCHNQTGNRDYLRSFEFY